jgi:hypothetical protein
MGPGKEVPLARRRTNYGQEKRAKELARKKKSEEKIKRRQSKTAGETEHGSGAAAGDDQT